MIQMSSNGSIQWIDERHIQEYVSNTHEHIIVKYDYVDICGIVWYHMLPLNRQLLKYGPLAGDSKKRFDIFPKGKKLYMKRPKQNCNFKEQLFKHENCIFERTLLLQMHSIHFSLNIVFWKKWNISRV